MKKIFLAVLAMSLLVVSCKNNTRNADLEADGDAVETENVDRSTNPYISDNQAEETPVEAEDLSGKVIPISASDFTKKVTDIYDEKGFRYKGYTPCIVDFYADWCTPCMRLKPVMARIAQKYQGKVIIYQVNVDHARDICDVFDIENIPTLMFFNRSEQPRKIVGAPSEAELETAIEDFLK